MLSRLGKCIFVSLSVILFMSGYAHSENKLPETVVSGDRIPDPDAKIGTYNQPRWTASRSFSNSRVYVIPEDDVEVEYWITQKVDHMTKQRYYLYQKEIEVGLGHGFQLDFYQNDQKDYGSNAEQFEGFQFELRWALAKWGEILLNPTLYFEYHMRDSNPDKGEFRLLLGEDLMPGWRFTGNLAYEVEFWDQKGREIAATAGLARKISNPIMIGIESKAEGSDNESNRGSLTWEYYVGPSLRWNPSAKTNILFTHLFGLNNDSHLNETFMIFGIEI